MTRPLTRVALALTAGLIIVWLSLLLRDSLLIARVSAIASAARATPAQLHDGLAMARRARLLNPDRAVPLSWEAELYLRQHRTPAALRAYRRLVAAEPQFADAWFLIATRAANVDPRLAAHARAELQRLDPLFPR